MKSAHARVERNGADWLPRNISALGRFDKEALHQKVVPATLVAHNHALVCAPFAVGHARGQPIQLAASLGRSAPQTNGNAHQMDAVVLFKIPARRVRVGIAWRRINRKRLMGAVAIGRLDLARSHGRPRLCRRPSGRRGRRRLGLFALFRCARGTCTSSRRGRRGGQPCCCHPCIPFGALLLHQRLGR